MTLMIMKTKMMTVISKQSRASSDRVALAQKLSKSDSSLRCREECVTLILF